MTAVILAAISAAAYGATDFSGALASKENDSTLVTVAVHVVSLLALTVVVFTIAGGDWTTADLLWGALGGVGAAYGQTTFFKALALGPMSTAASLTAVFSAAVPVLAGLLIFGDRPGTVTLVGIFLAVPAAVLVSVGGMALRGAPINITPRERLAGLRQLNRTRVLSVSAGFGFGLFFIALSRTSEAAGLFPLLGARVASIISLSAVLSVQQLWKPIARTWWPLIGLSGILDLAANSLYLVALRFGSFTWVAAVSSLYPVSTVLLARVVLGERLARVQVVGMVAALVALVLVGVGA